MKDEHIKIISDDEVILSAVLTVPEGEAKGAVILAHGITGEKHEGGSYAKLAKLLAKEKIINLRFDFRGHGESSGNFTDMTIEGEINDLTAAVKFFSEKGYEKVSIIGTSFGAGIAVLYTDKHPSNILSLTLLCPVLDYKRTFLEPETKNTQRWFTPHTISKAKETGVLKYGDSHLGHAVLEEFSKYQLGEKFLKLSTPSLVVHGTEDDTVPHAVSSEYSKEHPRSKFLSVMGAGHSLEDFEKDVFPEIVKWILKHSINDSGAV
ncbi:alpha/beta hydrolase [Candidatus Omnitrophota bacterium]